MHPAHTLHTSRGARWAMRHFNMEYLNKIFFVSEIVNFQHAWSTCRFSWFLSTCCLRQHVLCNFEFNMFCFDFVSTVQHFVEQQSRPPMRMSTWKVDNNWMFNRSRFVSTVFGLQRLFDQHRELWQPTLWQHRQQLLRQQQHVNTSPFTRTWRQQNFVEPTSNGWMVPTTTGNKRSPTKSTRVSSSWQQPSHGKSTTSWSTKKLGRYQQQLLVEMSGNFPTSSLATASMMRGAHLPTTWQSCTRQQVIQQNGSCWWFLCQHRQLEDWLWTAKPTPSTVLAVNKSFSCLDNWICPTMRCATA